MLTSDRENQNIVTRYIEEELKESYLTYAMSVNTNRAIPDVRRWDETEHAAHPLRYGRDQPDG